MSRGIRVVAPFRPFAPESEWHLQTQDFDWIAAIRMMMHTAQRACRCPVHILTDVDTDLPVPSLQYQTTERRLMLWTLEVCLRYLASTDFDRDTVMLDCDQLIYRDLKPWFRRGVDLGLLVRTGHKHQAAVGGQPFLNGVQFWARRGKHRLIPFYQRALALAHTLPADLLTWGADTEAVRQLIEPIDVGIHLRSGVTVRMIESASVLEAFSKHQAHWLHEGCLPQPTSAVVDFRALRKRYMRPVYEATIKARVA